jgi:L-ribulose-5-phosphate 3-epimerase
MEPDLLRSRIGFMQGRLSPPIAGQIQAFPTEHWRDEFRIAATHGFDLMEWTLDQSGLSVNPLMTDNGRIEIRHLCKAHDLEIPSLTGDCFMHEPFWKAPHDSRLALQVDMCSIAEACSELGIGMLMIPLVDRGSLENSKQEDVLLEFLGDQQARFEELGINVILESDYAPQRLGQLMSKLSDTTFGVNYDIGNSAALGFDPVEELALYGHRIRNVHIKDRLLGGTTVALGEGAADLPHVLQLLVEKGYTGNYVLQTARAENGDDVGTLCHYRDMIRTWLGHDES